MVVMPANWLRVNQLQFWSTSLHMCVISTWIKTVFPFRHNSRIATCGFSQNTSENEGSYFWTDNQSNLHNELYSYSSKSSLPLTSVWYPLPLIFTVGFIQAYDHRVANKQKENSSFNLWKLCLRRQVLVRQM